MSNRPSCPTASELPRIYGCPGYLPLKHKIELPPRADSADAAMGARCHAAYAGDNSVKLDDDEEIAVRRANAMTDELALALGFKEKPICEMRLYCGTSFSGQPDRIYLDGQRAFIPDAKFGRNAVEEAESNKQFRGYVALVAYNWPALTEIYVAPIQPWVSGKPAAAHYGVQEIADTLAEVFGAIAKSNSPDAPRIVGKHCKYCPLQGVHCPESRKDVVSLADTLPAADAATLMLPSEIANFLELSPYAEDVIEAVRDEAKRRLAENPDAIPGWTLKPGRTIETITDPEAVFARAEKLGVTQRAFMGTISIGKEKLKSAVKAACNLKGKDLEIMIESVTLGCTTSKQSAPSLVPVRTNEA